MAASVLVVFAVIAGVIALMTIGMMLAAAIAPPFCVMSTQWTIGRLRLSAIAESGRRHRMGLGARWVSRDDVRTVHRTIHLGVRDDWVWWSRTSARLPPGGREYDLRIGLLWLSASQFPRSDTPRRERMVVPRRARPSQAIVSFP